MTHKKNSKKSKSSKNNKSKKVRKSPAKSSKNKKSRSLRAKGKTAVQSNPRILISAIGAVLIISVIVSAVCLSSNKKEPPVLYDFGKDVACGIDVSEHNNDIDWSKVGEDFDFAFIRVGYRGYGNGDIIKDKRADENMKNAQKAGVPFGVYFYSQSVSPLEAKEEAAFTLDMIKGYSVDLPVVIDFEYAADNDGELTGRLYQSKLDAERHTDIINAFCKKITDKGYTAGVYASSSVMHRDINMKDLHDGTFVWVADYNDKVTFDVDYTAWQYSKTGSARGVGSKFVDLNYWYKK